tara:strand:+ start:24 stop:320 length:297 start_codon:yes stop_codon:yes gene_type:complete
MKNNYTVLLFIGAISATQLNTLKKHHQSLRNEKAWDAKTEANLSVYANQTQYESDTPAGYGGTANSSQSETNVTGVANATEETASALAHRTRLSQKGP